MSRIVLAACLFCAVINSAFAAEIRLGAEKTLSQVVTPGPAAFVQTSPVVASNGNDFFAVWSDGRRDPRPYPRYDLYGTRIGRDGLPLNVFGVRIAENASNAVITSMGGEYLVAYRSTDGVLTQRLDENGAPLAPPRVLTADNGFPVPISLVSNGSTYLILTTRSSGQFTQQVTGMLLDHDGVPRQTVEIPNTPIAVTVHGTEYVVVGFPLGLHTIRDSGVVTHTSLPAFDASSSTSLAAAFSPDAILIAREPAPNAPAAFLVAGYDGGTLHGAVTINDPQLSALQPVASWDGTEFAIFFGRQPSSLAAIRVAANGTLLDSIPFVLTSHRVPYASSGPSDFQPVFASADSVRIAVWPDTQFSGIPDIAARTFTSFTELAAAPDRENLISWSGQAETDVRVARTANRELAVWSEQSGRLVIAQDGVSRLTDYYGYLPGVAAGNDTFLVAWNEMDANFSVKVLAARIALDGRVLDATPIMLWNGSTLRDLSSIGIAFDGSTFLVTWSAGDTFMARLSEDGTIRGSMTFPISTMANGWPWTAAYSPRVAWTGSGFFLAYSIEHMNFSDGKVQPPSGIAGFPVDAKREPVPPTTTLFDLVSKDAKPLDMAVGAGRVTLVWPSANVFVDAQVTLDGVPVSASFGVVATLSLACASAPAIAWDGAEFVVAWTEGAVCNQSTVRAIRLNRFADPIDASPFDVAVNALSGTPSIVPTEDGVVIIYSHSDAANGDAPRAFERSLARLAPTSPRRRVVVH